MAKTAKSKSKKPTAAKTARPPKIKTESRGMRLPVWLWERLDKQAANKRISINQHAAELLAKGCA